MNNAKEVLSSSHRLFRVGGIEIRLLYIYYLFTGTLLLITGVVSGSLWSVLGLGMCAVLLLSFVLAHELGHAVAGIKEGLHVRRILLHPLGGLAMLSGGISGPMAEIFIALAGPAVSLALAFIFFGIRQILGAAETDPLVAPSIFSQLLTFSFYINLMLFLFNLLPIFPLDGGRVATAIAVAKLGVERGVKAMRNISVFGVGIMVLVGVIFMIQDNLMLGINFIVLGIVLYFMGQQEMSARMSAAWYTTAAAGYRETVRDPWSLPEWNPETGFAEAAPEDKPGWLARRREAKQAASREREHRETVELKVRVDELLAKVSQSGTTSLTEEERAILNRASEMFRKEI